MLPMSFMSLLRGRIISLGASRLRFLFMILAFFGSFGYWNCLGGLTMLV